MPGRNPIGSEMNVAQSRRRASAQREKEICAVEFVPEGPNESSPARSAGLAFRKSDPSRTGTIDGRLRVKPPG